MTTYRRRIRSASGTVSAWRCASLNDPKRLIEVLALRQDFPILMHQNQGVPGTPASLCLYFGQPER